MQARIQTRITRMSADSPVLNQLLRSAASASDARTNMNSMAFDLSAMIRVIRVKSFET